MPDFLYTRNNYDASGKQLKLFFCAMGWMKIIVWQPVIGFQLLVLKKSQTPQSVVFILWHLSLTLPLCFCLPLLLSSTSPVSSLQASSITQLRCDQIPQCAWFVRQGTINKAVLIHCGSRRWPVVCSTFLMKVKSSHSGKVKQSLNAGVALLSQKILQFWRPHGSEKVKFPHTYLYCNVVK